MAGSLHLCMSWPDRRLSPNARVHWAQKARAVKDAKAEAWNVVRRDANGWTAPDGPVSVVVTFYPPDKRRRDWDNLLASVKPHLDGIALALGIDDARFRPAANVGPVRKGGAVEIELSRADG